MFQSQGKFGNLIARWLYGSAAARAIGAFCISLLGGFLTSWLIADLTGAVIDWSRLGSSATLLPLALFGIVFSLYIFGLHRYDTDVLKWNDKSFREAVFNKALTPVLVQQALEKVHKQPGSSLEQLRKEVFGDD